MDRSDHNHAEDGEELHDDGTFQEEPQDWPADSDDDGQEEYICVCGYFPNPHRPMTAYCGGPHLVPVK